MRSSRMVFALIAGALFGSGFAHADPINQYDAVLRTGDGEVVGDSSLIRHVNRVSVVVRTSDLDPGAAMTVWWRVYNKPQNCAVPYACEASDLATPEVDGSQLHATAFVVGDAGGEATVVATLYRTARKAQGGGQFATSLTEGYLSGRGLRRPLDAEVELLFASHGRLADPTIAGEQSALDQLLSPGATPTDCIDPASPSAARRFRCGVIQKANHAAVH